MNDFESEEYKSDSVFLLTGRMLLHQKKYYLDFQSSIDWVKDLHYKVFDIDYNQSWLLTSDMSRHWEIIPFGAFTHSKGCQLQGSHLYLVCVELHPERFYPRIHQYELFLCSAVHCRDTSSCSKRQCPGIGRGKWGCRRKGGRSACTVLSWRGNRKEGPGNISWNFTQSNLETFVQLCLNCSQLSWAAIPSFLPSLSAWSKKMFLHGRRLVGDPDS